MSQAAFPAAILGWHDFFLASAGASAALLGAADIAWEMLVQVSQENRPS